MSDAVHKPSKVSREGVLLIKSFEGFRPRAMQRADGRWVIGYGHTVSAREGLTVSEADAELLLQYDLIPVVKAVVQATKVPLNQHQFDALASFAFSIGPDRYRTSDVLERLNAGAPAQAAAALGAWDDHGAADKPTRRRSAEHALFNAAPGAPVTLADLLSAPLPSPFAAEEAAPDAAADVEPAVTALLGEEVAPFPAADDAAPAAEDTPSTAAPAQAINPVHRLFSPYAVPAVGPLDAVAPSQAKAQAENAPAVETPLVVAANDAAVSEASQDGAPEPDSAVEDPAPDDAEADAPPAQNAALRRQVRKRAKRAAWAQTATFLFMGALGMLSFGTAMAAFLRASTTPGGDTATIGWVLVAIALACVGVSGYNLYQRWGRGDRN